VRSAPMSRAAAISRRAAGRHAPARSSIRGTSTAATCSSVGRGVTSTPEDARQDAHWRLSPTGA
jgi:hypothetical protein